MLESENHGLCLGQIIADKYRITRLVGRGGMAVVVEAVHLQLAKPVALKLVPRRASETGTGFEEARAVARLSSEHAVRVFDCGVHGSFVYVVMELLSGRDLEEYLSRIGALSVTEAVEIVLQVSEAIGEAHSHGIVHADLKPANLFVSHRPDGSRCMKVLDFGIARDHAVIAPSCSVALGSPGYAAPEQMVPNERIDARADVWALGVILYELLSGRRPFDARDLDEALLLSLTTSAPSLASPHGPLPPNLVDVVMRCLAKDREDRFANVGELVFALSPFVQVDARPYVRRTWAMLRRSRDVLPASARNDGLVDDRPTDSGPLLVAGEVGDERDVGRAASAPTKFLVAELAPPRPRASLLSILTAALMLGGLLWVAPQHVPTRRPSASQKTVLVAAAPSPSGPAKLVASAIARVFDGQLRDAAPKMPLPKKPTRRSPSNASKKQHVAPTTVPDA